MVSVKLPAMVALHETVAVPDTVMLLGVMLPQVSPDGIVSVRVTVPENWFTAVTVIVVLEALLALTGPGGLATIVKFRYWNSAIAVWIRDPLDPVSVSV